MKKQTKLILIALCLLTVICVVAFASCKSNTITVTVNLNLPESANQSFTVDKETEFYSMLESYVPANVDGMTFVGWEDKDGVEITSATRWDKDGTVYAVWNVEYTIEYYLETSDGFVKSDEHSSSKVGKLGATVTAEQISITGYTFDSANANNAQSATLTSGTVLKMYYKRSVYTVTFNKNYADATGEMAPQSGNYGETVTLAENAFVSNYEFGGWSTSPNGLGDFYADKFDLYLTDNLTLYAQWRVSYTEEIYVEKFDGSEYVYVLEKTVTQDGYLGNSISVRTQYDEPHYFLDYSHPDSVSGTQSLANGDLLKAYYSLERLTITYVDDNNVDEVRYGQQYTIRTPEQDDNQVVATSYCVSPTGNGTEYKFGQVITVTDNLTLYPIAASVFTDIDGSGDSVEIRAGVTGKGAIVLVKGGNRYEGFLNEVADSLITFDVTVNETEVHGKLLDNGKFVYRNEDEAGTFLYINPLFPSNGYYPNVMLALDGYGTGVYSTMLDDGSGRAVNYFVSYKRSEEGDYEMEYYLPANPDEVFNRYFNIARVHIEGAEQIGQDLVGYFMFCGNEYGGYIYVENGSIQSEYVLYLDGYGNFVYYYVNGDEEEVEAQGVYVASEGYTADEPEYILYTDNKLSNVNENLFILFTETNPSTNETYPFFMFKHEEAGDYLQNADSEYPKLYLDGYGGAMYISSEIDEGSLGSYTVQTVTGGYEVYITFIGENTGTLRVIINRANKTFEIKDNNFRVDENGVLTEYFGNSSVIVIPEQVDGITVTEIANGVFNTQATDKYYTSVTLPSTITTIGERAFQNNHYLRTVYISAATPPTLGQNAFHWMRSDLLIIVPSGCEDDYRNAEGWTAYSDYITSETELANKPLFEIKDGVLKSYNPTDTSVTSITIPDEVTEIANGVFAYREYITSVNLNNVKVIGANAFDSCVNLADIDLSNVTAIGKEAFFGCFKLTEVNLNKVQTIGEEAFNYCVNLAVVNIGSAINSIGSKAFAQCGIVLDENGDYATDENGDVLPPNDIIVTITAETAPNMADNIFQGGKPSIYVSSYEVGVAYAEDATANWTLYARYLRVKNEGESKTYYSVANMGDELTLDDRALYGDSGLYKWNGNTLTVAWFIRDEMSNKLRVVRQTAAYDETTGELRGLQYNDEVVVFVVKGTVVSYVSISGDETLTVKFGTSEATFNGADVTMKIVNYRMQFDYQGYTYLLKIYLPNEFTYTKSKITYTKTYTAADGSSLTVDFGNLVKAVGTLNNVDGEERFTEVGWYLNSAGDNKYIWDILYRDYIYKITATFNEDNGTFTYKVGISVRTKYSNNDDFVMVTAYDSGRVDIQFNFKTANGTLDCNCLNVQAVEGDPNTFYVTINIMIDEYDSDGNKIGETPSVYDGNYTITLNTTNNTYTLQRVNA